MSQYININFPVQMNFLIDTLKSLDQKSKKEIYLKVFVDDNSQFDYQTESPENNELSLDEVIFEIQNTPQNPDSIEQASGLLAEHLAFSDVKQDFEFNVSEWNKQWDELEMKMKAEEFAEQEFEAKLL